MNVTSSSPVAFTTKVTTSGSASAASPLVTHHEIGGRNKPSPLVAITLLGVLLIWMTIAKNRPSANARASAFCALLLICILAEGISGCGGASAVITPPPQQVVTPKGNYVVTVTASAGTLPPQTISLTLTVN